MRAAIHLQAPTSRFNVTLALINPDPKELAQLSPDHRAGCAAIVEFRSRGVFERLDDFRPAWRSREILPNVVVFPSEAGA